MPATEKDWHGLPPTTRSHDPRNLDQSASLTSPTFSTPGNLSASTADGNASTSAKASGSHPSGSHATVAASMPENARERLREAGALLIDADAIARAAGNAKCANVVLVGALAARLDIPIEVWEETVAERVPQKTVEANLAALRAGRAVIENEEGE